ETASTLPSGEKANSKGSSAEKRVFGGSSGASSSEISPEHSRTSSWIGPTCSQGRSVTTYIPRPARRTVTEPREATRTNKEWPLSGRVSARVEGTGRSTGPAKGGTVPVR